jgi:tripartite-type tricarboxylate transporter receptor subunit TctC
MERSPSLGAALLGLAAPRRASAKAAYPDRTITLIAPFAPGESSHVLARATAQGMGQRLGKTSQTGMIQPFTQPPTDASKP